MTLLTSSPKLEVITPNWPAPTTVRAVVTTRNGGVSQQPYDGLNLGDHVGDDPLAVAANRELLRNSLSLPREPVWLRQVHGTAVLKVAAASLSGAEADAAVTQSKGVVCAVMTADCLPIFLCDRRGTRVGVAHAGWRGLAAGVIERAVEAMGVPADTLLAWLGPAIGPSAFEVGRDVVDAFAGVDPDCLSAFKPVDAEHWLADIYALARRRLAQVGVTVVFGGDHCTFTEPARFYSFRRDGVTGRMASLIWLQLPHQG